MRQVLLISLLLFVATRWPPLTINNQGIATSGDLNPSRIWTSPSKCRLWLDTAKLKAKITHHGFTSVLQSACVSTIARGARYGNSQQAIYQSLRSQMTMLDKPSFPARLENEPTSQLMMLGFTAAQTSRIVSYFVSRRLTLSSQNVTIWLQLLRTLNVGQPCVTAAKFPIILAHQAEHFECNASAVVTWMLSIGLAAADIPQYISKCAMLLIIPYETVEDVAEWLRSELGWSSSMVAMGLAKFPQFFGLSPTRSLGPKLAWFKSKGVCTSTVSQALSGNPQLFGYSIARNESQMAALQAIGLSQLEVIELISKRPSVLMRDTCSHTTQAKVCFLTTVMGKKVQELLNCSEYLTYSLGERIGPRWAFHSHHCPGKPFKLNYRLKPSDPSFVNGLLSMSLKAECVHTGCSHLQLFEAFKVQWKERKGTAGDSLSHSAPPDAAAKDETLINFSSNTCRWEVSISKKRC